VTEERAAVTVVDLGLGNLGSVLQGLLRAGGTPTLSADPEAIARAPRVILPGVAAFGLGMDRAERIGLRAALEAALSRKTPVLGICLGMQILFEEGDEDGTRRGLGLLPGRVTRLPAGVPTPHIGWQRLEQRRPSPLLDPARPPWSYFANAYRCEAPAAVTCAVAEHQGGKGAKIDIAAVVARATLHGVQFHPEKSAADGEKLLQRFLALPQGGAA
jgi:glutamine amidotransferase